MPMLAMYILHMFEYWLMLTIAWCISAILAGELFTYEASGMPMKKKGFAIGFRQATLGAIGSTADCVFILTIIRAEV